MRTRGKVLLGAVVGLPIVAAAFLLSYIYVSSRENAEFEARKADCPILPVSAELFADVGGILHGIAVDPQRHRMYVASDGKRILAFQPDGAFQTFAELEDASGEYRDGPGDTFIYDLALAPEGTLYAAAEDRVVAVSPAGALTTLLQGRFDGPWGLCGITVDDRGRVFVTYDDRVARLDEGELTVIYDGSDGPVGLPAAVGLVVSNSDPQALLVAAGRRGESGRVVKLSLADDGTVALPETMLEIPGFRPEYLSYDAQGRLLIAGPENAALMMLSADGTPTIVELEATGWHRIMRPFLAPIAFGDEAFGSNVAYAPDWFGRIFRIRF